MSDIKITPEQLQEIAEEQQHNQRELHKRRLLSDLKAFAILLVAFASIIATAELSSPAPLFIFCLCAGTYFLLKPVKKRKEKKRNKIN